MWLQVQQHMQVVMSERHMVRWPDHWAPQSTLVEVFNVPLNSAEAAPLLAGMQGEGQVVKVCVTVYMCAARVCMTMAQSAFLYSDTSNVWLLAHCGTIYRSTEASSLCSSLLNCIDIK